MAFNRIALIKTRKTLTLNAVEHRTRHCSVAIFGRLCPRGSNEAGARVARRQRQTQKPGAVLTRVRFLIARHPPPSSPPKAAHTYGVQSRASTFERTLKIRGTGSRVIVWTHESTAHTGAPSPPPPHSPSLPPPHFCYINDFRMKGLFSWDTDTDRNSKLLSESIDISLKYFQRSAVPLGPEALKLAASNSLLDKTHYEIPASVTS